MIKGYVRMNDSGIIIISWHAHNYGSVKYSHVNIPYAQLRVEKVNYLCCY